MSLSPVYWSRIPTYFLLQFMQLATDALQMECFYGGLSSASCMQPPGGFIMVRVKWPVEEFIVSIRILRLVLV